MKSIWNLNSWILNCNLIYKTLTNTFQIRPYESYKHLNSISHRYPFLFCFQVSRLLLRSSHCEATWLIMAGSNQLTSLWISFLLRWWRTRAPWQKAQRVCLPSTVTSSNSKPLRNLDTFHYINLWTCFFNFETVYVCECHIFTNSKLAHLENCFQQ